MNSSIFFYNEFILTIHNKNPCIDRTGTECEFGVRIVILWIFGDSDLVSKSSFLALTICVMSCFVCYCINERMVINKCGFTTLIGQELNVNWC